MLSIAILDDEEKDANHLAEMLRSYFSCKEMEIERMDIYHTGPSILKQERTYDLLFLDIEVGKENGIAIAKRLRENHPEMIIIVITGYLKYSMDGYKIQAARYLLKPVPAALLYSELDEVLSFYHMDTYVITNDLDIMRRIKKSDVLYIESYGRKVQLHTLQEAVTSKESITYWKNKLAESFFIECYKGILVHVKWIKEIEKDTILLENEQSLPLARRRSEAVRQAWFLYQEKSL